MKIMLVLSRLPYPLEKGDKLRAYHQIKQWSKASHEIYLFCTTTENTDSEAVRELIRYCTSLQVVKIGWFVRLWTALKFLWKGKPLQCAYFYNRKAQKKLDAFYEKYTPDVIFCQLVRMMDYVQDKPCFKVMDYQDCFSFGIQRRIEIAPFYLKPFLKYEYASMLKAERLAYRIFDFCTIISEQDCRLLPLQEDEKKQVRIFPNGVDSEFFSPSANGSKEYDILFTGNMAYPPNEDASRFLVRDILPLAEARLGRKLKVLLAGTTPTSLVRGLASENVVVSGWLDSIVEDAYRKSKVFVAPMRIGTGMQNKLLEAMSCALPSVTTPLAAKGLGLEEKKDAHLPFLVGETAEELAEAIVSFIEDGQKREAYGRYAREVVVNCYSWQQAVGRLKFFPKEDENERRFGQAKDRRTL